MRILDRNLTKSIKFLNFKNTKKKLKIFELLKAWNLHVF